ncbi:MT-A70-domain-containing protein [Aspergillus oleicola]
MTLNSSILYQNASATVFLIDIPTSITLAQELPPEPQSQFQSQSLSLSNPNTTATTTCPTKQTHRRKHLLSTPPRKYPYPTPPEPKTPAKRAKVLARTPLSERELYDELTPLLFDALGEIQRGFCLDPGIGNEWCLPRVLLPESDEGEPGSTASGRDANGNTQNSRPTWVLGGMRLEKRKRRINQILNENKKSAPVEKLDCDSGDDDDEAEEECQRQLHTSYLGMQSSQRGLSLSFDQYNKTQNLIQPPLILAPGRNAFENEVQITDTIVKNTSCEPAVIDSRKLYSINSLTAQRLNVDAGYSLAGNKDQGQAQVFYVPPLSTFISSTLPLSPSAPFQKYGNPTPIPHLSPNEKFNLILLDPPWSNKSVSRSGHYKTQTYSETELLTGYMYSVLAVHSHQPATLMQEREQGNGGRSDLSIAALWTTNSAKSRDAAYTVLARAGFSVVEEWVWVKVTAQGQPVTPIDGLWRKPYEIIIIGKRERETEAGANGNSNILRRVIAAVPDVHSRKPNMKEVFERFFFTNRSKPHDDAAGMPTAGEFIQYSALEVFARNLTAGWWAVGDEVLKFNAEEWWVDGG